jgi:hypothetical protein
MRASRPRATLVDVLSEEKVMETQPLAPALYALMVEHPADNPAPLEFCRNRGFLGVGWGVGNHPLDWKSYEERAIEHNGAVHTAVREIHELPVGALIWARALAGGDFYLAKVTGPWRYLHGPDAEKTGMHNVRPVEMVAFDASNVPLAIATQFVGNWVIQRFYGQYALHRSSVLFDERQRSSPSGRGRRRNRVCC